MSDEMSPAAQRVMGAMKQFGRPVMAFEFLENFRGHFTAGLPHDKNDEPAFRPETWAVIQLDVGMRQCEEAGLLEQYRNGAFAKMYRLTPKGLVAIGS